MSLAYKQKRPKKENYFRFEYCYWKNNGRNCDFEWKRKVWGVVKKSCIGLNSRVEYIGDYDLNECAIEIKNITPDDSGKYSYGFLLSYAYEISTSKMRAL